MWAASEWYCLAVSGSGLTLLKTSQQQPCTVCTVTFLNNICGSIKVDTEASCSCDVQSGHLLNSCILLRSHLQVSNCDKHLQDFGLETILNMYCIWWIDSRLGDSYEENELGDAYKENGVRKMYEEDELRKRRGLKLDFKLFSGALNLEQLLRPLQVNLQTSAHGRRYIDCIQHHLQGLRLRIPTIAVNREHYRLCCSPGHGGCPDLYFLRMSKTAWN